MSRGNTPFIRNLEFEEFDLQNNLHCILHKDNSKPLVNILVGYKVGSKDEPEKKKGIAHLFEHLMFQGSKNIKKNEHPAIIQNAGGICNAGTMQDFTFYFDSLPMNQLETGLWLESDRMISLDLSKENLENQKKVVIEEKHSQIDNAPYGTVFLNIFKEVFRGSKYEWGIIGNEKDIESFTTEEAVRFHKEYYSPGNSVLLISGDIDYGNIKDLVSKYFGSITKGNSIRRAENVVSTHMEDKQLTFHDNITLPAIYICYIIPKAGSEEEFTLDYFSNIIANNESSRLYKKLVYEKKLVKSINALKYQLEDAGIFVVDAMAFPETDLKEVENAIFEEINQFTSPAGINKREFEKVRNAIELEHNFKYLTNQSINFEALINWMYFKEKDFVNKKLERFLRVSIEDMIDSVKKYIIDKEKIVTTYLPKKN
ncbi:M16 family metallopeptidase [Bacteroidota bacterium]